MTKRNIWNWQIIERVLPWGILTLLAVYTYAFFFVNPNFGFDFSGTEITEIFVPTPPNSLQVGDKLVQVGSIEMSAFANNLRQILPNDIEPGQSISIIIERNGQEFTVDWVYPGFNQAQTFQRLNSLWWLPYIFWMAGTATLLFIRPKDKRWRLLIAFNYLTALWLVTGSGPSHWHVWQSAIILRSAVWLCLPVYIRFHWFFPTPLRRLPNFVWVSLYLVGSTMALLEWFQVLPRSAFYVGFLLAIVSSVIILVAHIVFQRENRREIWLLVFAIFILIIPPLWVSLLYLFGQQPPAFTQGGSLLAFPALPGGYFYIAFRHQFAEIRYREKRLINTYLLTIGLGVIFITILSLLNTNTGLMRSTLFSGLTIIIIAAVMVTTSFFPFLSLPALAGRKYGFGAGNSGIEIRANRLLSLCLFLVIVGTPLVLGIVLIEGLIDFPGEATVISIITMLLVGTAFTIGYAPFQRFVNQRILGIRLPPTLLLETYSERITTSLDKPSLVHLITREVLPSLFVRQSTLIRISERDQVEPLFKLGLEDTQLPDFTQIPELLSNSGEYIPSSLDESPQACSWIRLVLPLKAGGKLLGLWLLGVRDPDDYYAPTEITIMQSIANQTAIALVNLDQAERLRTLYRANVERQEQERSSLVRDLHDDILNRLAVLSMKMDENISPEFEKDFQAVIARLREMISGLRPAMLGYGLPLALEELGDEFLNRTQNAVDIQIDVLPSEAHYDPRSEEHLYRIAQQACENALRHAQASSIRLYCRCDPDEVILIVEDDGIGMANAKDLDFNQLMANKHFGIASMFERAEIIGAEIEITSTPHQGTKITVIWQPENRERES